MKTYAVEKEHQFPEKPWHAIDKQDKRFNLYQTPYILNLFTRSRKTPFRATSRSECEKTKKGRRRRKRSAADAMMQNASGALDEKPILEKFQHMMQNETKDLHTKIISLKHQLKNSGGGVATLPPPTTT